MARYRVHLYIDVEAEAASDDSALEAADAVLLYGNPLNAEYLSVERLPAPTDRENENG